MGSNQSSFLLKMVLSKGAFYPLSFFVCTLMNCWIASSLRVSDAIWVIYRMHVLDTLTMSIYLRHLSVLFRTICENFAKEYHVIFNEKKSFCMRIGVDGTAPRRSVTMNGEPILWKSQIQHLGNFITHDLSDLNDITYKTVSSFLKLIGWTQDFPLFQVASKVTYYRPTAVPSMGARRGIYTGNMSIS